MVHYILKPRTGKNLDMIAEGKTILGLLTDKERFPKMRESLEEYTIRIPEQKVEFKLKTELDSQIHDYLSRCWEIVRR